MLKYLDDNTWGIIKDNKTLVKAKIWIHPQVNKESSFYKVGMIGNFECLEETSCEESKELFTKLEEELKQLGCQKIIGPMNGNTWQDYRLTTFYGDKPPFLLEIYTPSFYIKHWVNFGFLPEEEYSSYITPVVEYSDERIEKIKNRFAHFSFNQIQEKDLEAIFNLSLVSFKKNPYYIDIDKNEFLTKYKKMIALLNPNVSWVVYDNKELIGYAFCTINYQGIYKPNDSIIIKTTAIKEERKYAGLGVYLLSQLMEKSLNKVDYIIHALMHDSNPVQNIIKNEGEKIRGYTLYYKMI